MSVPAETVLPTERGLDGYVAGLSTGLSGVTPDGAAAYSLPLWLPAGRADMQPELALTYRSDAGNGVLGLGWSLAGLSKISRCGRTQAQDGAVEPITFTSADAFCLDGQRLVAVQGASGASDTEYRTEREGFTKIVSLDADSSGPRRFRVYLKNGRILTYGELHGSTLEGERIRVRPLGDTGFSTTKEGVVGRLSWALARMEDRSGNAVDFHYVVHHDLTDSSHEQTLEQIEYTVSTAVPGMQGTRFVDFVYGTERDDAETSYVAGLKLKLSRRLDEIRVRAPNPSESSLVRSYRFTYAFARYLISPIRLASFKECDGAGACMRPVSFTWMPETRDFQEVDTGLVDLTQGTSTFWTLNPVDVDGDGRDDLLYRKPYDSTTTSRFKWTMRFMSPSGQVTGDDAVHLPVLCWDAKPGHDGRWVDVNQDGFIDVSLLEWSSCGPSPSSRLKHFQRTHYPPPSYNWFAQVEDDGPQGSDFWYADVNGDGLPDLVRVAISDGLPQLGYRLNVAGSLQPFQPIQTSDLNDNARMAVNLSGTSKSSLLILEKRDYPGVPGHYETVGQRYWAVTLRNGTFEKQETTLVRTDVSQRQYVFADINGDGLPDALRAPREGGDLQVFINTGNGFAEPYAAGLSAGARLGAFTRDNGIRVFDYNGDGRQDLLLMDDEGGHRGSLMVLESDGEAFVPRPLSIPVGQPSARGYTLSQVLDANGDGLTDLAQVVNGSLRLYLRKGPPGGLLTGVTDSLGARVEFDYKPMSDPSVYTPGTTCVHPQRCVRKGRWLVAEHRVDAGEHPLRVRKFSYEDGRMDLLGRGWLGFAAVKVHEVAASTELRTEFDNQTRVGTHYPYAKLPRRDVSQVTGGGRLRLTLRSTEYSARLRSGTSGGTILTVLPDLLTEEVYDRLETEPETAGLLRRVETDLDHDWTYGNPTSRRRTLGADVLAWTAEYQNDASNWLVGLALVERETSTVNGASTTRTRAYAWQPGTALLARETVEPGDASLERVTSFLRHTDGLVHQITHTGAGLSPRTTHIHYASHDSADRTYPVGMTNALGHPTSIAYHSGLGVIAESVDANGLATRWQYDGFGRVRGVDVPGNADVSLGYADCAAGSSCSLSVKSQQRTSATADGAREVLTAFDRLGRPLSTRTQGFDGQPVLSSNEYDGQGRLVKQWVPSPAGGQPVSTSFTYDNLGRPLRTTFPDGTSHAWQYEGSKVTFWDEKGQQQVTALDAYGRILTTEDLLGARRVVTRYSYGSFGLLEAVTNGYGQGPRSTYDRLGRRTRLEDPDSGVRVTRYNAFGEVAEETDANGDTTVYARDVLGRIITETSRDGVSRFKWDQRDPDNPKPGNLGRLLSSVQEGDSGTSLDDVAVDYTYDAHGRPVEEDWRVEGASYVLAWTYDEHGLLRQLRYPGVGDSRFTVEYEYKPWGALESVRDASGPTVYWRAQARNGLDQLTSEMFGNGVVSQRRYDRRGRVLFIDTQAATQPLQALAYEYEANSNLRSRHDRLGRTTEDFTYDSLDRLTSWTAFQNCGATAVDYSYDDLGNLLGRTVRQGVGQSLSYFYEGTGGAGPHAMTRSSLGAYTYDGNGNQLTAPDRTVEYSTFNLPTRITRGGQSVSFRYDAMNRRTVKRSSNGDVTVSIGGLYEVRRASAGTAVHAFGVLGAERSVAQVSWATDAAGAVTARKVLYLHTDHLGSVETVTDEAGAVVERMRYEPFGGRRYAHDLDIPRSRGSPRVRQGFTGHEHDEELGLINMQGRMYDATLGRFLSPDPFLVGPRPSQALNRYSYVLNNPLRYTDPTGYETNELPVIVYDSWYGSAALSGGSGGYGAQQQALSLALSGLSGGFAVLEAAGTRPTADGEETYYNIVFLEQGFVYFFAAQTRMEMGAPPEERSRFFGGSAFNEFARDAQNLTPADLWVVQQREDEIFRRWWERAKLIGPLLASGNGGAAVAVLFSSTKASGSAAVTSSSIQSAARAAKAPPNPFGKKGGPAHQAKVKEVADDVASRGLDPVPELRVPTPGGHKQTRFADVAGRDPATGQIVEMHQVGRQTAGGNPVPREVKALDDIQQATGVRPTFHPYNP
ncbi:RHS repeat-associated core domain-containing protein [Pyxidicoccus sp. 3LG]